MNQTITSRQLWILYATAMLSPFLRLIPGSVTVIAGKSAWVSAGLSLLPAMILSAMLRKFSTKGGLQVEICRIFGRFLGCVVLTLWAMWMVFHSGFVLRSGAQRFVDTIYPAGGMPAMIVITGILCAIAATGRIKPLARVSELFLPMMLFVIVLVIVFSLKDIDPTFLLPVTADQLPDIALGVPQAVEAVSVALLLWGFSGRYLQPGEVPDKLWPKLMWATVLNILVCVVAIGNLGSVYTGALEYPGFILARDLSILSGVERVEALIVGLWLLPDFVLVTAELILAGDCLQIVFSKGENNHAEGSRGLVFLLAAVAVLLAFRMVPEGQSLRRLSTKIIPVFQLSWAYGLIPLLVIIGKLRRKF